MFDGPAPTPAMQRVRGTAAVAFAHRSGRTHLSRLAQAGSAKAMLPRVHAADPEVVFLNTAGGLTGGDRLSYELSLAPGARATATTQTAERAYAAAGGMAEMEVRATLGAGTRLDWLPQETILFDRSALSRRTEIALAGDAECLMVETLVLGRAAMGETVERLWCADHRRVTRDGRAVLIDPVEIGAGALASRTNPSGLAGARAMAVLAFIAPGAEDAKGRLRGLSEPGVTLGVSGWDGRCLVRALAVDAFPLRRLVARAIAALRPGPLPRVWSL